MDKRVRFLYNVWWTNLFTMNSLFTMLICQMALFPFPPPHTNINSMGLRSDFTRLIMKIKYVSHGLNSLQIIFHDNRKIWTVLWFIINCRRGRGKEKEPAKFHNTWQGPGADVGFSRGGRIFKKFSKILSTLFLFLGRPNWFFELSQSTALPYFSQNFCTAGKILKKKKHAKKGVFRHFLESLTKKLRFFGARPFKTSMQWRPKCL